MSELNNFIAAEKEKLESASDNYALTQKKKKPIVNVKIVDIDIPFGNMLIFMILAAFAAIPAVIIVYATIFIAKSLFILSLGQLVG